jgi:integrase
VDPFFVVREKRDKATHQVMGQERGTVRRFLEACGDRPVDGYHRGDISAFLDTLRRLPNTYGKSPKDKDRRLADIIAEADAKGAERLTDKTVKRHLSALSQFFRYAMDCGHIGNQVRRDLVDDHRFREERGARDQRDAWTPEELKKLFSSPVWTGCLSKARRSTPGKQIIRDARFWLPVLALYHGARLEELADLYRRDVWCDAGTWAIRIVETEGNPESGDRRLKTENAERVVPLHPEVIRLGFPEYVAEYAPGADDPVFPDLKPQGPDLKRGPRMTRWFVEYRRAIGLFRPGVSMHAFRHTAITRLTDAITDFQQKRHRDFMMDHAGGGGGEGDIRYDKGAGLKAMADTLALLRYPEVDLSQLYIAGEQHEEAT